VLHHYIIFFFAIMLGVLASIKIRKLTVAGGITGGVLAIAIYLGIGVFGILMLGLFFLLGTLATAWQANTKAKLGISEGGSGQRTMGQVLANGGVAGILGFVSILYPEQLHLWAIMCAGSLASATADTLSSELGSLYGKRFYNCITFKKDLRGLDGVVSIEGLLIGISGSALIAMIYCIGFGWTAAGWLIVLLAGTIGNLADSVLGATLERKGMLHNNMVNFLNTLAGALTAMALFILYLY
jgi:uncharacterized protein (TIGR00297 family)